MKAKFTIEGIQEAQDLNNRVMAQLKPSGGLGRAVKWATMAAHRYLVSIAHVDTGAMRSAQRQEMETGLQGRIFTDTRAPGAHGTPPSEYVIYENARGGTHALYDRTVDEAGPRIADQAVDAAAKELPL